MNRNFEIYKYAVGGMLPTQEDLVFQGANIDFADYIAPNITGIGTDAAFAQKTANDRLDALLKQRQTLIDEIKLDKKYENITGQFRGQLESLIDQAAQSQLSDNANFTKFNTGLLKIKNDVVLQKALKSTENAKAYADWRTKNPNALDKAYLNGGNEDNFQRWKKGETDEFIMEPTYVEPNWQEDLFKKAKDIPDTEKEIFRQLGSAVYQEKTKGKKAEDIKARMNNHVNYLLTSDPKTAPHFKRMMQFGYDPLPEIQKVINSAADLYKNESVTLSAMSANPNKLTPYQQRSLAVQERNAATSERNSLNRMADEGNTGKIKVKKKPGAAASDDKVDITYGTYNYNKDYKADIALAESTEDETIDPTQVTIIDAEPSGRITYKVKLEDGTEKFEVKDYLPLKQAISNDEIIFLNNSSGGKPPKTEKTYKGLDANGKPIFK
jgi:hypothetical protein